MSGWGLYLQSLLATVYGVARGIKETNLEEKKPILKKKILALKNNFSQFSTFTFTLTITLTMYSYLQFIVGIFINTGCPKNMGIQ